MSRRLGRAAGPTGPSWRRLVCLLCLGLPSVVGCDGGEPVGPTTRALPAGVVARVGELDIAAQTVAAIASEQNVSLPQARDRAVYDALLACGARADLPPRVVADGEARVLARALLRTLWAEARQKPITDAELAEATERHWTELDRPIGYRAVHAVALADAKASDEQHQQARALAARIRDAVEPTAALARAEPAPARSEEQMFTHGAGPSDSAAQAFTAAAKAVPVDGQRVRAEVLHPLASNGQPIERGTQRGSGIYDADFTAAVVRLGARGDLSNVVKSSFGYHVVMLLEKTPAKRASRQECLALTRDEILRLRARRLRDDVLTSMSRARPVDVTTNADALMAQVRVSEPSETGEATQP